MKRTAWWPLLGLYWLGTASSGCTDVRMFTDEERDVLAGFALTPVPPDPSNAYADDPRAAVLGKQWYFDSQLSGALGPENDGTNGSLGKQGDTAKVSCASCHDPAAGGSDHRSRPPQTSLGAAYSGRNAQSLVNAAYINLELGGWQTWDGSSDSLWGVNLIPLEHPKWNNATRLQIAHVLFRDYRAPYEAVFGPLPNLADTERFPADGKPGSTAFDTMLAADKAVINRVFANVGKAMAAYLRVLTSPNFAPSAFDRMLAGDDSALSDAAIRGARLFIGKAACDECHRGPALADQKFHNIGCPQIGDHAFATDLGRYQGIPVVMANPFNRASAFSDAVDDSHLRELTRSPVDIGAFKTPTLRNVAKTAPYMHDGAYATLGEVVQHYNQGGAAGNFSGTREVTLSPLLLDSQELSDLVEFLRALDDGDALERPEFPEGLVNPPPRPVPRSAE